MSFDERVFDPLWQQVERVRPCADGFHDSALLKEQHAVGVIAGRAARVRLKGALNERLCFVELAVLEAVFGHQIELCRGGCSVAQTIDEWGGASHCIKCRDDAMARQRVESSRVRAHHQYGT
ncbi:hypothetical protein [Sorangium sp. So ce1182]|uniref:hypothetical protein n=1 Tax=Sorangium sp. So ce1182 TaxID=3133334 RepID=UPI003F5E6F79